MINGGTYREHVRKLHEIKDAALDELDDPTFTSETGTSSFNEKIDFTCFGEKLVELYFSTRLPGQDFGGGTQMAACCPFHHDTNPSLSINRETGKWTCHGCNRTGNIYTFEREFSNCKDNAEARKNVHAVLGIKRGPSKKTCRKLFSTDYNEYIYTDAFGKKLYKVACLREDGKPKEFRSYARSRADNFWLPTMKYMKRRVLFNLPAIRAASTVIVVEGEKDADRLAFPCTRSKHGSATGLNEWLRVTRIAVRHTINNTL
jgi:hypothetical protein